MINILPANLPTRFGRRDESGDGVGALDFDPFFYAQDDEITNLVIGKADANGVVKVKFKNFGKDEEITFTLSKKIPPQAWKIESIMYSDAEDLASILQYGMMSEAEMKEADSKTNWTAIIWSETLNAIFNE